MYNYSYSSTLIQKINIDYFLAISKNGRIELVHSYNTTKEFLVYIFKRARAQNESPQIIKNP